MKIADDRAVKRLLDQICSKVRSQHCALEIRRELLSHLEDAILAKTEAGLSHEKAVQEVIREFGDASEIGTALDRVHHPLYELPWTRAVVILGFIVLNQYVLFGGHIGQMLEPKAFILTLVLALFGAAMAGRQVEWKSALRSLVIPPTAMSREQRVRAWYFFEVFSRNIQRLSVIVGIAGTIGMASYIYLEPKSMGAWLATAWLGYFYGLIFGVLLARIHAANLRATHRPGSRVFLSRFTSAKLSVFVQGLAPVLVIQSLISVISHLGVNEHELVLQSLMRTGCGLLLSAVLVALLPTEPHLEQHLEQHSSGVGLAMLRLRKSALLYQLTPIFAFVTVGMVLVAVWR